MICKYDCVRLWEKVDYLRRDWDRAKKQIKSILREQAKMGKVITYIGLTRKILVIHLRASSPALISMLKEVSEEEDSIRHGMLSVVVVGKRCDKLPGEGFFVLAKQLH